MQKENAEKMKLRAYSKHESYSPGMHFSEKDLLSPYKENWLNDIIINSYFSLIEISFSEFYCTNSFFLQTIEKLGIESAYQNLQTIDLLVQKTILVPVFYEPNHWSLIVFEKDTFQLMFFDSLGKDGIQYLEMPKDFLIYSFNRQGIDFQADNLKILSMKNIPKQLNCNDCGVFVLCFARAYCINKRINNDSFKQHDIHDARIIIKNELLNTKLIL